MSIPYPHQLNAHRQSLLDKRNSATCAKFQLRHKAMSSLHLQQQTHFVSLEQQIHSLQQEFAMLSQNVNALHQEVTHQQSVAPATIIPNCPALVCTLDTSQLVQILHYTCALTWTCWHLLALSPSIKLGISATYCHGFTFVVLLASFTTTVLSMLKDARTHAQTNLPQRPCSLCCSLCHCHPRTTNSFMWLLLKIILAITITLTPLIILGLYSAVVPCANNLDYIEMQIPYGVWDDDEL